MKYFIDAALADWRRRSLPFLIASRQCYLCQNSNQYRLASSSQEEYIRRIVEHCSNQRDYLSEDTPLKEAIFRVLLSYGNRPMDAAEISAVLTEYWAASTNQRDTSERIIELLLQSSQDYCIASEAEQDLDGWRHQRLSELAAEDTDGFPEPMQAPAKQPRANGTPTLPHPGEPYDSTLRRSPRQSASPEIGDRLEKLLFWMSAIGEGPRSTFTQACLKLGVVSDVIAARSVLRRLRLLGHVELSRDGGRWEIAPATLVRIASDPDHVFLAGQRSPSLPKEFGDDAIRTSQPNHQGPPRFSSPKWGSRNMEHEAVNTAAKLAELLPTLAEWEESLADGPNLVTAQFTIERWDGQRFRPNETLYQRLGRIYGESGMYRFKGSGDSLTYERVLYFDEPNQRLLQGDWYGLRFLANSVLGGPEARHDSSSNVLFLPEAQRWPHLYERALVLASGFLPQTANNPNWLLYDAVPYDLARTLCRRLNVKLRQENGDA